jgi:pimeloyl-ACP methyl ester carboxylesterase
VFSKILLLSTIVFLLSISPLHAQSDIDPVFESSPCPVAFNVSTEVECGTVTVPQDRENPGERTVAIAVAVFKARSDTRAADPVILLDGGPGSRTLDSYAGGLGLFLSRFNRNRDVIIFDYRGMGYSEPALTCSKMDEDGWEAACRDRFTAQGVDFTNFTTRDNAADAADIVHALGYESYNVWGGSYGSSVALTLLRDHPENIRAAIITALQAPQGDLQSAIPANFQHTLDAISALCEADETCASTSGGNLTEKLGTIVDRLNANPLPVTIAGVENMLTGDNVVVGLGQLLKDETNIPIIPGLIASLYAEQYEVVMPYVSALSQPPDPLMPIGAWLSMRCTDSILATTPEMMESAFQRIHPAFRAGLALEHQREVEQCQTWGARVPTNADRLPATADTPTLIISGELDMYSSETWLNSTLANLPNGYGFMLPYHMHYVIHNRCASGLLVGFIEDPTVEPDASCMAAIEPPTFSGAS